jgi:hypothetical protein
VKHERHRRIAEISERLGDRTLVWFGIRGDDAAALLPIRQFRESYAITAPFRSGALKVNVTLEELTGRRVDLDAYDIDFDERPEVRAMRAELLDSLGQQSAVTAYRPAHFLSNITFATQHSSVYLGMFKDQQDAFEHKPWLDTELGKIGVRTVPWEYIPTERRNSVKERLDAGPVILRPCRTSGGVGISLVRTVEELEELWRDDSTHLMGVAPFFDESVPLNVGACAFVTGEITVHPCSVQLIGVPSCTHRQFGYCGNDFAAVHLLDRAMLEEIDSTTRLIGRWLTDNNFRGAFGVDYLLVGDTLYFTEVNARMQGSTRLSAALAMQCDRVDVYLDHLAAFLGLVPAESLSLVDWSLEIPDAAQLIVHNVQRRPVLGRESDVGLAMSPAPVVTLEPGPDVKVEPGGVIRRLEFNRQITNSGYDLIEPARNLAIGSATR